MSVVPAPTTTIAGYLRDMGRYTPLATPLETPAFNDKFIRLSWSDSNLQAMAIVLSASGNNAVAIDNKIEQAMDLVKSHLMFAVREEVEVLKEKIAELMERISHLEVENNLLRNNATPDTLMQLNSLPQQAGSAGTYQPTFNPGTGTLM